MAIGKDPRLFAYFNGSWSDSGILHLLFGHYSKINHRTHVQGFAIAKSMALKAEGIAAFRQILVHPSIVGDPGHSMRCFNPGLSLVLAIDQVPHQILCCMKCLWIRIHANGEAAHTSIAMSTASASALLTLHAKYNGTPTSAEH